MAAEGWETSSGTSMEAPRLMSSEAARRAAAEPAGAGRCAVRASHSTKKALSSGSTYSAQYAGSVTLFTCPPTAG